MKQVTFALNLGGWVRVMASERLACAKPCIWEGLSVWEENNNFSV